MRLKRTTFGFLLLLLCCFFSTEAQITDSSSVYTPDQAEDTAKVYKRLYNLSRSNKLLYNLYKSVFRLPRKKSKKTPPVRGEAEAAKLAGRPIRSINILVFDPVGYNLGDTTQKPHSFIQRSVNTLHVSSKKFAIRNRILIGEGEPLDLLKLKESTRLIRSNNYIRDVKTSVASADGDSVDVTFLVLDYWSIRPTLVVTSSEARYRLVDQNFLGLGHTFDLRLTDKYKTAEPAHWDGRYTVPSLGATYISPSVYFDTDPDHQVTGFSLDRPFYSPLTEVAWGIDIRKTSVSDSLDIPDTTVFQNYKLFKMDYWLGYSMQLHKGETEKDRVTRFIMALRYIRDDYQSYRPFSDYVTIRYPSANTYLGSVSLSKRKYAEDRYIFNFGIVEDVPEGKKLTLTSGVQHRFGTDRYYMGADLAFGKYFPRKGYLYGGIGYGHFLEKDKKTEAAIFTDLIYFSPLIKVSDKWRLRNFLALNYDHGINKDSLSQLQLNTDGGIPGYKEDEPVGSTRISLTVQMNWYAPWNVIGFRFAPILLAGVGTVGKSNADLFRSRVYQTYGFGFLIKNEYLVVNSFQITIALYPILPAGGSDFRFNPVKLREDRFYDFDISKPQVIVFE